MTTFATIAEAIDYVDEALSTSEGYPEDYDMEAIAREVTEWRDGRLVLVADGDEFWAAAMRHDRTNRTKAEFRDFVKEAAAEGVDIIPEIDSPAHSRCFIQYNPRLKSPTYDDTHLDLLNPESTTFMEGLWKEYLSGPDPVFAGKNVNIGTDEYSNKDTAVVEAFRRYTDHFLRYVEQFGKTASLWGSLTHAAGKTPVKAKGVRMNLWYNGYADPKEMIRQGYTCISIPDRYTYIVPMAGYYYDYLNCQFLYDQWTPNMVAQDTIDYDSPAIIGGMFAVWNDKNGNGISVKDIHHRLFPAMQTLAV